MSIVAGERELVQLPFPPTGARRAPVERREESARVAGRPGGLAVGPDRTVFVSVPASGTIWQWTHEGGAASPLEMVPGRAGTPLAPTGLAVGDDQTLFVADAPGHRVWAVAPGGALRLVAGSAYGLRDGPAEDARFRYPADLAVGQDGTIFVADSGNHCIRTISPEGLVETLAGSIYDYGDGQGRDARFRQPVAIDVDGDGTCYVADTGNSAIRRVTPDGEVTTVAGSPPGGAQDGAGATVGLHGPTGIALGRGGEIWVADHGNGAVRRIDPTGTSVTAQRWSGRRWPSAVATGTGREVLVAVCVLADAQRPEAQLLRLEASA